MTDPNREVMFDAELVRTSAPANCFLVFIGGEYLDMLDDVVRKVENVTEGLVTFPTIFFTEDVEVEINPEFYYIYLVKLKKNLNKPLKSRHCHMNITF